MPDAHYYAVDSMMPKAQEDCFQMVQWGSGKGVGAEFDFDAELLRYCRQDVTILEQACVKFRTLFMTIKYTDNYQGIVPSNTV